MSIAFLFISAICWTLFDLSRKKLVANETPLALTLAFNVGAIPLYLAAYFIASDSSVSAGYWLPSLVAATLAAMAETG